MAKRNANSVRNAVLTSCCAMSTGAALMYFFDPDRGNRRRALVRDKAQSLAKDSNLWVRKVGRDIGNRARGFAAETRSRFSHEPPSDEVLAERIRSRLGRYVSHPGAISVSVNHGEVTLSGDVLASEVEETITGVNSVRDVRDVRNELTTHSDGSNIPALQGARSLQKPGFLPKRSPATRMILGATGGALAVYGVTTRTRFGRTLGALGLSLLTTQLSPGTRRLGSIAGATGTRIN